MNSTMLMFLALNHQTPGHKEVKPPKVCTIGHKLSLRAQPSRSVVQHCIAWELAASLSSIPGERKGTLSHSVLRSSQLASAAGY